MKSSLLTTFQVDPDEIISNLSSTRHPLINHHRLTHRQLEKDESSTPYTSRYAANEEISKFRIPKEGVHPDAVAQMLRDELDLDGRPNLNLARYLGPTVFKARMNADRCAA